jgi:hypothetical protein
MSAAINRIPLDVSKERFEGVPLTATQAERLLSICVDMIDLCAEVTGKIDPAVGTMVAYACDDVLNGILGTKP